MGPQKAPRPRLWTGTWYNKGDPLVIPAGRWRVEYAMELEATRGSEWALEAFATLSTAVNSEVNTEGTTKIGIRSGVSMRASSACLDVLDLAGRDVAVTIARKQPALRAPSELL